MAVKKFRDQVLIVVGVIVKWQQITAGCGTQSAGNVVDLC